MATTKNHPLARFEQKGNVMKINIEDIDLVTATENNSTMKVCLEKVDDDPSAYEVQYSGPLEEGLELCRNCGKYHSKRVTKCNNPECKGRNKITSDEVIDFIRDICKTTNRYKLWINSIRIK